MNFVDPTGHSTGNPCELLGRCEETNSTDEDELEELLEYGDVRPISRPPHKGNHNSAEEEDLNTFTCNNCVQGSGTSESYEGISNSDIDDFYSFWEYFVTPINGIVSLDDVYRMSGSSGWKAARYSLNLGFIEAIVQGSRQAYRDSWYESLSPQQRIGRVGVVGGEALLTDAIAGVVGKGFGAAGGMVGGPAGAAGGYLAGSTEATNKMDYIWMHYVNPNLFSGLGVWP